MNLEILAKETLEGRRSYSKLLDNILVESKKVHGPIKSHLEGFAIIYEEFKEFEAEVLKRDLDKTALILELASVGAMCQRFAEDVLKTTLD